MGSTTTPSRYNVYVTLVTPVICRYHVAVKLALRPDMATISVSGGYITQGD